MDVSALSPEDSRIKMKLTASDDGTSFSIDEGSLLQVSVNIENSEQLALTNSTLNWTITGGSSDFVASNGVVIVSANTTTISFPIEAKRNSTLDDARNFTLEFSGKDFENLSLFKILVSVVDKTTPATLAVSDLNFGAVLKGTTTDRTLTVTNSGEALADTITWASLTAPLVIKTETSLEQMELARQR